MGEISSLIPQHENHIKNGLEEVSIHLLIAGKKYASPLTVSFLHG
jgi:hypothetical protein